MVLKVSRSSLRWALSWSEFNSWLHS